MAGGGGAKQARKARGKDAKNKSFKKGRCTKNRQMDIDQVYEDIEKGLVQDSRKYSIKNFEFDELLPGGGRFYCQETARHFINANALAAHKKTKEFKKRCRELKKTPYSQAEADRAAGLMKETYKPIDREALASKAAAAAAAAAVRPAPAEEMDM